MEKILAINPGSASRKYALYEGDKELWRAHFEKEGGSFIASVVEAGKPYKVKVSKKEFENTVEFLKEQMKEATAIGVRVVAPGKYFLENRKIDKAFIKKLAAAKEQAPLHVTPALLEIEKLIKIFPKTVIFSVSDSSFYSDMPANARLYSLPAKIAEKFGIYRYGYHGISINSVLRKIKNVLGRIPERVVVCHLGSGSSVVAIKNERAFDASMGFTPLEGLPMGTRIGNIDAGAIIYLAKKMNMSPDKLGEFLNRECGLLGLSGKTSDVRELLELEMRGDSGAAQALESYIYGVKKLIGSYAAAMGGLDLLVFTATIGERSFIMRDRICSNLAGIGIALDVQRNNSIVGIDGEIGQAAQKAEVWVLPTEELPEIVRQTIELYKS